MEDECFAGKIRGIIPYQPAFRKYEVVDVVGEHGEHVDTAALIPGATCPQCEDRQASQERQIHQKQQILGHVPYLRREESLFFSPLRAVQSDLDPIIPFCPPVAPSVSIQYNRTYTVR